MRKMIPVVVCFIMSIPAFAQKGQPAFGKVDKADLELTDCDFDKGAEAETLIAWGNIFYRRGKVELFNTVFENRVRVKILKESGLSYANVSIPYFDENNEEQIQKISAYTYNLDGSGNVKVTEVGKSSIYSKRLDRQHSAMIIAFPEAKVGSIVEYKYTMERQTMGHIKDWYFQSQIPTRYSEYQLNIPAVFHFTVQPSVVDHMDVREDVTVENIAINEGMAEAKMLKKNYIMHNLRGIRDEPFMGSARDYLQRLEFQLSQLDYGEGQLVNLQKTWADVVASLMKHDDFGSQLEKRVPESDALIAESERTFDQEAKIRLIYNYVRKNMTWNQDESIYAYNGINKTWKDKVGSSGDINLLLVNLLKKAGLFANPILFSTRENGLVNSFYPFLNQFNTVMACVQVKDKNYILDATDKISGFRLVPEPVVNTKGFIVKGEKGEWIEVIDVDHKYRMMAAVQATIDNAGVMKGNCLLNSYDYAKRERSELWLKDKEKFKESFLFKPYPTANIEAVTVNNAEVDSLPLEQKIQFNTTLDNSGDYRYFKINLFSGLDKNVFIAEDRVADVDFGYLQSYSIYGSYSIPDSYGFEPLPENISMVMPDKSIAFSRQLQAEANLLNVRITLEFKNTFYAVADYPDFKEFYKKMFDKLNEQVVIKKKQ